MKKNLHPNWNHQGTVTCSCGNTFKTGLTKDELHVDICSACHPFFTGEMKFVDRQGRVDKFLAKQQKAQAAKAALQKQQNKKAKPEQDQEEKSYKEILRQQQLASKKQAAA